jgi:hypothetical protein
VLVFCRCDALRLLGQQPLLFEVDLIPLSCSVDMYIRSIVANYIQFGDKMEGCVSSNSITPSVVDLRVGLC